MFHSKCLNRLQLYIHFTNPEALDPRSFLSLCKESCLTRPTNLNLQKPLVLLQINTTTYRLQTPSHERPHLPGTPYLHGSLCLEQLVCSALWNLVCIHTAGAQTRRRTESINLLYPPIHPSRSQCPSAHWAQSLPQGPCLHWCNTVVQCHSQTQPRPRTRRS